MRKPNLGSTSLSRLENHLQSLHISEGGEKSASSGSYAAVSEEEIMAVMVQKAPITTRDLVNHFYGRLRSKEEKDNFANILWKMARLQKNKINGINYLVLREGFSTPTASGVPPNCTPSVKMESTESDSPIGAISQEEIRAVLIEKSPITTLDLVKNFAGRLRSKEEKEAFAAILRRICRVQKFGKISYIVPREWSYDRKQARLQSRLEKIRAARMNIHQSFK